MAKRVTIEIIIKKTGRHISTQELNQPFKATNIISDKSLSAEAILSIISPSLYPVITLLATLTPKERS